MTNEELKSKEQIPVETPPAEEESILNRPRPKLNMAGQKNPQKKLPEKTVIEEKKVTAEEPPKKPQSEIIMEKALDIWNMIMELLKKVFAERLKTGYGLKDAGKMIISNSRMMTISLVLILITIFISIFLYHYIYSGFSTLLVSFYSKPPALDGLLDYLYYPLWGLTKLAFHAVIISISFFIPFILAYILTSPVQSMIRYMTDDMFLGKTVENTDFSFEDAIEDIKQTLPSAGIALGALFAAFFLNLIAVIGQVSAFVIIIAISALLVNEMSFRKYGFDPKKKLLWMKDHSFHCLRTGSLPSFLSALPLINNVIIAFLMPLFIVHAALNFEQTVKEGKDNHAI